MAGQRQPTDLVVMNGRKHLTKAEIEARKNAEVVAPNDKVKPPSYLTPEQKKKFRKIAKELLEIKLIANVDCDALARLLIAQDQYIEITQQIRATPLMEDAPVYETKTNPDTGEKERVQVGTRQVVNGERERLMIIQDRCMSEHVPSQRKEPLTSRSVSRHGMSCKSVSRHTVASASFIH